MEKGNGNGYRVMDDSILVGIIDSFKCCKIIPQPSQSGRVSFRVEGDVDSVLERIYRNEAIGALDVLKAIKATRQALFQFKDQRQGNGEGYANGNRR